MHPWLLLAIEASLEAGRAVLAVYDTDFSVDRKADDSPLTLADRRSHQILVERLRSTGLPILSEEGRDTPFRERRQWKSFWLLDPLDGTKEFVKRNGEFTVNVALVEALRPIAGVVYAPVHDTLYYGSLDQGAFKLGAARAAWQSIRDGSNDPESMAKDLLRRSERLPVAAGRPKRFTIVGSRSHGGPELETIVRQKRAEHGDVDFISAGSSLKFCLVAEGRAHLYPRTGPTMEWDTAAGQAVAEAGGAEVVDFETGRPLRYNKEDLHNPWFLVKR